jgi:hypothetical protein
LILFEYGLQYIDRKQKKELPMKKLLMATLLVLAALTETPDDYRLSGSSDKSQMDAYLSVWANSNAEEVQVIEEPFFDEPALEVNSGSVNPDSVSDSGIAI